jgi:predicted lipid-binding transport protein (Tim44 family)
VASPNVNTPGAILGFLEGIKMESLIVGGAMIIRAGLFLLIIAAKALISFGMFGTRRIQKYLEKRRNAIANHQPAPSVMDGRNPERYYEEKFEVPKKPMPEVLNRPGFRGGSIS